MINIPKPDMERLIGKIDHRHPTQINWTEFQNFMEIEGGRREIVNNAQLYGVSVKRLYTPPERHAVDHEQKTTSVEYYIESMVYLKH